MFSFGPPSSAASCQSTLTLPEGPHCSTLSACGLPSPTPTDTGSPVSETWPTPASRPAGQSDELRVNRLGHKPGNRRPRVSIPGHQVLVRPKKRQDLSALIALGMGRAGGCWQLPRNHGGDGRLGGSRRRSQRWAPRPAGAAQAPSQHVKSSHSLDFVP